jgi:hypothetical protein
MSLEMYFPKPSKLKPEDINQDNFPSTSKVADVKRVVDKE